MRGGPTFRGKKGGRCHAPAVESGLLFLRDRSHMPKKKTSKTAAKRFKRTAAGRIRYGKAGTSHLLSSKNRKRKRRLRAPGVLSRAEEKRVKELIAG